MSKIQLALVPLAVWPHIQFSATNQLSQQLFYLTVFEKRFFYLEHITSSKQSKLTNVKDNYYQLFSHKCELFVLNTFTAVNEPLGPRVVDKV